MSMGSSVDHPGSGILLGPVAGGDSPSAGAVSHACRPHLLTGPRSTGAALARTGAGCLGASGAAGRRARRGRWPQAHPCPSSVRIRRAKTGFPRLRSRPTDHRREELITEGFAAPVERPRDSVYPLQYRPPRTRNKVGRSSATPAGYPGGARLDYAQVLGAPHPTPGSIRRQTALLCHRRGAGSATLRPSITIWLLLICLATTVAGFPVARTAPHARDVVVRETSIGPLGLNLQREGGPIHAEPRGVLQECVLARFTEAWRPGARQPERRGAAMASMPRSPRTRPLDFGPWRPARTGPGP